MIGIVFRAFVRQRINSPMRMIIATVLFGGGLLSVLITASLGGFSGSGMGIFGAVFAAGLIGQEVSSGVLTLAFARPLRRAEWVVGRWLGASALAGSVIVLQIAIGVLLVVLRHGQPITARLLCATVGDGLFAVAGASAVLLMFSALVPGLGDLGLVLLAFLMATGLSTAGSHYGLDWMVRAGQELQGFVSCDLATAPFFGAGPVSWFAVVSYFSTIAICLTVAIAAVNRKELSYASG